MDPQQDTHDHRLPVMTSTSSGFYGAVSDMTHARLSSTPVSPQLHHHQPRRHHNHHHHHYHHHDHSQHLDQNAVLLHSHLLGLALPSDAQKRISTYILEAGVAAHSVIIGVTLGVATGSEFTGLLVALLFHQFFEGNNQDSSS
jgi:zinc transporter 1/2/3